MSKADRKALALQKRMEEVEKLKQAQEEEKKLRENIYKDSKSGMLRFMYCICYEEMMLTDTSDDGSLRPSVVSDCC
jgi:hypothetical protein